MPSYARRPLLLAPLAVAAAALLAVGCGNDKGSNPVITPLPENSTPAGAMALFEKSYEQQNAAAYAKLFTANFHFRFSEQSDPVLAAQYGFNWGPADEDTAARHLFAGFTSTQPPYNTFGGATSIVLTLVGPQYLDDFTRPDSTRFYKYVVVPTFDASITVVNGSVETVYEISAGHDFYLVRGDAAVLASDQPADSLHWYIYRWDDKSPAGFSPTPGASRPATQPQRIMPSQAKSWGSIKDQYRR